MIPPSFLRAFLTLADEDGGAGSAELPQAHYYEASSWGRRTWALPTLVNSLLSALLEMADVYFCSATPATWDELGR